MKNSLISIIIVNYNGKDLLLDCLNSIKRNSYKQIEIIVVDNGSTDGSVEYLSKLKINNKKITIIENNKNVGFAKANNQGVEKALGEFILLLNNDVVLTKDSIEVLLDTLSFQKRVAVVQPKIIFSETGRLQCGGTFLTSIGFLYHFGYGHNPSEKKYNQEMEVFSGNGACLLIKKEVIKKVGLFDGDFFAYYEETDFCHRVWLAGYKVLYEPKAVVYHKGSQTSKKINKELVFFLSFKNTLNSKLKNFQFRALCTLIPVTLVVYSLLIIFYFLTFKLKLGVSIIHAILWNVVHLSDTIQKRKKIQNAVRKLNDREYLNIVQRPFRLNYYLNSLLAKEVLFEDE